MFFFLGLFGYDQVYYLSEWVQLSWKVGWTSLRLIASRDRRDSLRSGRLTSSGLVLSGSFRAGFPGGHFCSSALAIGALAAGHGHLPSHSPCSG